MAANRTTRRPERYLIKQEITGGHSWRTKYQTPANVRSFVAENLSKLIIWEKVSDRQNLIKPNIGTAQTFLMIKALSDDVTSR